MKTIKRLPREEPVKRFVRKLTNNSWNRSYMSTYIEQEINENVELLLLRCQQVEEEPMLVLKKMEKRMKEMPNFAFSQALPDVLGLKGITGWGINGWEPPPLRYKRKEKKQ